MWRTGLAWFVLGVALARAAEAAPFDVLDAVRNNVDGVTNLYTPRALAVSPDGKDVYVAAKSSSAVTGFAVDAATGALSPIGSVVDGVDGADALAACNDVAVSPDGKHVYAAGYFDDAIAILARDATTGALHFVGAVFDGDLPSGGLVGPSSVAVSPDGKNVYATAILADTIVVFARDADTGLLTLVEVQGNDPDQLLDGVAAVAVSPLGDRVYAIAQAAAPKGDSLVTFARDPATGALTKLDAEQDGVAGVSGLALPNSLAVSPDGAHVYTVAGSIQYLLPGAIAHFVRSPADGTTGFQGAWTDGVGGVDGIAEALGVAVMPDGRRVLVAGFGDNALAIFARDPATGLLSFERAIFDAGDATRLLGGAIDVAVDPAGRFVYVAAGTENALTVLAPEPDAAARGAAASGALALLRARARRTTQRT